MPGWLCQGRGKGAGWGCGGVLKIYTGLVRASRLAETPPRRPRIGLYIASNSDPPPGCVSSSIQPPFGPPLGLIWLPNSPKITPESSKMFRNHQKSLKTSKIHKNQFLQHLRTRNFTEISNLQTKILIYIEKSLFLMRKLKQKWRYPPPPPPLLGSLRGP